MRKFNKQSFLMSAAVASLFLLSVAVSSQAQNNNGQQDQGNNNGGYQGGGNGGNGGNGGGGFGRRNQQNGGGGGGGGGNGGQYGNQQNNQQNGQQGFGGFNNRRGFGGQGGGGGRGGRNFNDPNASMFQATSPNDTVNIPAPPEMTADFVPLTEHSIFFKGRFVYISPDATANTGPALPREAVLVLHGCANTDGKLTAFLEDTDAYRLILVHQGDTVAGAGGKITEITLDYVEYQSALGRRYHVSVGQNLVGDQVFGSNAVALPTIDANDPNADTLRKLAAKRQAELNGTK
jgi:hypothetical protein